MQDIPLSNIRNFGIIAHIDHGKSTLADRLLEIAGNLTRRTSTPTLDTLPVERIRGITVKAQAASMFHHSHLLNLIDTPGHADFSNEVNRSLAAMQGVLLIVDAAAGVQAQTVAHYLRVKGKMAVIPVINKVDLPQADVGMVMEQMEEQLGLDVFNMPVLAISAKSGLNVESILPAIIERIPPPSASVEGHFEATLIDCWYKEFRGVVCMISVKKGKVVPGDLIKSAAFNRMFVIDEVGILQPELLKTDYLHAGQVGYIRCGMKSTHDALIGDTFLDSKAEIKPDEISIPTKMRPVVFAGMFPTIREEYDQVMMATDKLLLNDSSVTSERIVSVALGPGWKLGFLGSLHMDVFAQRLEQEFGVSVILTSPNVSYSVKFKDGTIKQISSSEDYPTTSETLNIKEFREPFVKARLIFPVSSIGQISQLCSDSRCGETLIEYLSTDRVLMTAELPLVEIIGDFNDRLLSISAGYASLDYEAIESRPVDLVKIGVRLNGDLVDVLSTVQPKSRAEAVGRGWVKKLAGLLPRQQFAIAVQAVIGNRIIAREDISAVRKDYGGDKTRKMKLLEAQKEGKARMRMFGKVEIPHDAFVSIMKLACNK